MTIKKDEESAKPSANVLRQGTNVQSAANESKDAITGRIIHTVNMMKEVL